METKIIRVSVNARLVLKIAQVLHSGVWIGICDPLGITLEADTHTELMESFSDAINSMMVELLKSGELDAFLKSKGWKLLEQPALQGGRLKSPVQFDVPYDVRGVAARESQAIRT